MIKTPKPSGPKPVRLLTLAAVAEALGCSIRTLRRRIEARELPVIRDGRLIRIDPEDLRRYLAVRRLS
jgi:excisionase family DNA binding protein